MGQLDDSAMEQFENMTISCAKLRFDDLKMRKCILMRISFPANICLLFYCTGNPA